MGRIRVLPSVLAGACLAAAAASAAAQDPQPRASLEPRVPVLTSQNSSGVEVEIGVVGRVSLPSGTVESAIPLHYDDLFKTGLGVSVEGSLLWPVGPKWHVGPYLSLGWDSFDGKTFTDPTGDTLKPDALDEFTFLVGARSELDLGNHFRWEAHLAFGAAQYSTVNAVFVTAGTPMDVRLFDSSTAFAFDIGTRFTYDVGQAFFELGLGVRSQGSPREADFTFNSGALVTVEFEFGVGVRF